jgi:hypothetical protein
MAQLRPRPTKCRTTTKPCSWLPSRKGSFAKRPCPERAYAQRVTFRCMKPDTYMKAVLTVIAFGSVSAAVQCHSVSEQKARRMAVTDG